MRVNLESKDSAKCVPQCLVRGLASTKRPIKHFLNKRAEDLDWGEGYRRKKRHKTEEPSTGGANCAGDLGGAEREEPGTIWDSTGEFCRQTAQARRADGGGREEGRLLSPRPARALGQGLGEAPGPGLGWQPRAGAGLYMRNRCKAGPGPDGGGESEGTGRFQTGCLAGRQIFPADLGVEDGEGLEVISSDPDMGSG